MSVAIHRALAGVAVLLGACARQQIETPKFGLDQCRRIELIDAADGRPVIGAEDLAIDRIGGRLLVSAYDRRAVERAASHRNALAPDGGLYAIALGDFDGEDKSLAVRSLVDPAAVRGGLRPHGIAYDEATGVLTFINRAYERENGRWRMTAQVAEVDRAGVLSVAQNALHCSANDLAPISGRLLITLDHGTCGWRAGAEDIFGARNARIVDTKGETLLAEIGYANGIAETPAGEIAFAATREKAIYIVGLSEGIATRRLTINVNAGPDNLSVADDGRIVAAVHPSLWRLGMQRRLGIGRSPSRIVEIDPESGDQRLLFDDPRAMLVSAATAAISTGDRLIVGSVMDRGLVVCRSLAAPE